MTNKEKMREESNSYDDLQQNILLKNEHIKPTNIILPVIIIIIIISVMCIYSFVQRKIVVSNAEQVTNQMAEYIAVNISNEMDYAKSSIKLSSLLISQSMTSEKLDNPYDIISPMIENTPFRGIEYIQPNGMNVMNIGEPFDASDRVYYIEGIKGNTGIWNNYHPKTSKETLIDFYTPLMYNGKIAGVITGYIAGDSQIANLFETKLYNQDIYGLLIDENEMVICSTLKSDYIPDMSLDIFMERFETNNEQKRKLQNTVKNATYEAISYKDPSGQGRICVVKIPNTNWKVAIIVPAKSFNAIITNNTRNSVATIVIISLILISYASYVLLKNIKRHKEISAINEKLEKENQIFNEENKKFINEIVEIRDIIASANMGIWRIELVEGKEPKMYVDDTMKKLLGIENQITTPEQTYINWFSQITPEALPSVLLSVDKMKNGFYDENTYLWNHPTKGQRYVRCGGTSEPIAGGISLRGYHYDVDEVVRADQAKAVMLQDVIHTSKTDDLTGLLNRRAYDEDYYEDNDIPKENNFVYVSLDVNGLKQVNDNLGHAAGDELLKGASYCMKTAFGTYGKIYRTGGDEFTAIIFCDNKKMEEVLADFEDIMISWSGQLVDNLSISYGWISKAENPELTVRQLGSIADKRMYESKSNHYRKIGVDRRGQKDAHKALQELYTKILKINISDDSYQIVNMYSDEQTPEKGFSDKISEWFKHFGESGQVHPDDLKEFLHNTDLEYISNYFKNEKTSLHIFYRRKYEDDFKKVMMEIIPANDYTPENQSLFLYVKNIDK